MSTIVKQISPRHSTGVKNLWKYLKSMPVKPKGVVLAEFVAEGKTVRARYKSDHKEVDARSPLAELSLQSQTLAQQLNQQLGAIEYVHG